MSDMRATERLLEVIQEKLIDIRDFDNPGHDIRAMVDEIVKEIAELRRRGDTLVRERDLREITDLAKRAIALRAITPDLTQNEALERLDNAIGGNL
jgi:hypothetical protein